MAHVEARDNKTGEVLMVAEEWLERWPEDYTVMKPSDGSPEKEKHHGR